MVKEVLYTHSVRLMQNRLHNNTAAQLGALSATEVEISHCIFSYNTAIGVDERDGGGVLCVSDGYVNIETSRFEHNTAMEDMHMAPPFRPAVFLTNVQSLIMMCE